MKAETNKRFIDWVDYMQKNDAQFSIRSLSKVMQCTTERIRRIRLNMLPLQIEDFERLHEHYNLSIVWLLFGIGEMFSKDGIMIAEHEAPAYIQRAQTCEDRLKDKDRIIALLEEQIKQLKKGKQ